MNKLWDNQWGVGGGFRGLQPPPPQELRAIHISMQSIGLHSNEHGGSGGQVVKSRSRRAVVKPEVLH